MNACASFRKSTSYRQATSTSSSQVFFSTFICLYDTKIPEPITFEQEWAQLLVHLQGAWDRSRAPQGPLQELGLARRTPHVLGQGYSQGFPPRTRGDHPRVAQLSAHHRSRTQWVAQPGRPAWSASQMSQMG